jgi:hypothetical protein
MTFQEPMALKTFRAKELRQGMAGDPYDKCFVSCAIRSEVSVEY